MRAPKEVVRDYFHRLLNLDSSENREGNVKKKLSLGLFVTSRSLIYLSKTEIVLSFGKMRALTCR